MLKKSIFYFASNPVCLGGSYSYLENCNSHVIIQSKFYPVIDTPGAEIVLIKSICVKNPHGHLLFKIKIPLFVKPLIVTTTVSNDHVFFSRIYYFYFMYLSASVNHVHAVSIESRRGLRFLNIDHSKLPHGG